MNRSCKSIVGGSLLYYLLYLAVVLEMNKSLFKSNFGEDEILWHLHLAFSTVFITILVMFLFLLLFSTGPSQTTTAAFGTTICIVLGLYHFLVVLGFDTYDAQGSLLQLGAWSIVVPLIAVMFAHIFKVQERYVFIGGALMFIACSVLILGSLSSSQIVNGIAVLIGALFYFPVLAVISILCFKLHRFYSSSQVLEMKVYGMINTGAYVCFAVFSVARVLGAMSKRTREILLVAFELFFVGAIFVLVFCFHFKHQVTRYQIKLVDLEKANSAQKLFLRFIFHEVRVPFHSLLLGLEYLAAEEGLENYQALFETLIQSAEMMERTINDVLLLSRLEDGKLELQAAAFSMDDMVEMIIHSFKPLSESKSVALVSQLDPSLPPLLYGDRHRISQIIANLVSNAIKFSKAGCKVQVTILVLDLSVSSCFFQIQVKDEGLGMTAEDQKLLFSPYSQIRPHETQEGRGSGLGLSIVKHIVELHDGSLDVSSELKKGSTFSVTLRLPIGSIPPSSTSNRDDRYSHFSFQEPLEQPTPNLNSVTLPSQIEELKEMDEELVNSEAGQGIYLKSPPKADSFERKSNGQNPRVFPIHVPHTPKWHTPFQVSPSNPSPNNERGRMNSVSVSYSTSMSSSSHQTVPTSGRHLRGGGKKSGGSVLLVKGGSNSLIKGSSSSSPLRDEISVTQGPRCVLVVDDSLTNRRLTRMILEQQGFVVEEACNGEEAVEMARQKEYWVIFMDNQMPVMNGVEATRKISQFSESPIIGLTGNSLDEDVQEFIVAGARNVLIKPCKKDKILGLLSSIDVEERKSRYQYSNKRKIVMNHAKTSPVTTLL